MRYIFGAILCLGLLACAPVDADGNKIPVISSNNGVTRITFGSSVYFSADPGTHNAWFTA